ncbi:MAG: hypothetical protein U0X93_09015 [Anaerolineales bacterium]
MDAAIVFKPTGPPPYFFDDRSQDATVNVIESQRINLQQVQRFFRDSGGDRPIRADLGEVADAAQGLQRDARSPTRPLRNFPDA